MLESYLAKKPLFIPRLKIPTWNHIKPILKTSTFLTQDINANARLISSTIVKFKFSKEHKKVKKDWWYKTNGKASQRIWKQIASI